MVTISVCMPVTLQVIVEPEDVDEGTWQVTDVTRASIDAPSAERVLEFMSEEDMSYMDKRANEAEDLP